MGAVVCRSQSRAQEAPCVMGIHDSSVSREGRTHNGRRCSYPSAAVVSRKSMNPETRRPRRRSIEETSAAPLCATSPIVLTEKVDPAPAFTQTREIKLAVDGRRRKDRRAAAPASFKAHFNCPVAIIKAPDAYSYLLPMSILFASLLLHSARVI